MSIVYGASHPGWQSLNAQIVRTYNAGQRDNVPSNFPQMLSYKPSTSDRTALRAASSSSAAICVTLQGYFGAVPDTPGCYAAYYHEPDNDGISGYPADYITEWNAVLNYVMPVVNAGRTNHMKTVAIYTGGLFANSNATVDTWVPSGVDAIGEDSYASFTPITNAAAYAVHAGKPWCIPEFGTVLGSFATDAAHLSHMQQGVAKWTGVANPPFAVCWFDQFYNILDTTTTAATSAGATSLPVAGLPTDEHNATTTYSYASGSTLQVDPYGTPDNSATNTAATGSGVGATTLHLSTALGHAHPSGSLVYLMPTAAAYWAGLNGADSANELTFGADSGTVGSSTTVSFQLPNGIVNGSYAVAVLTTNGASTVTLSGSWSQVAGSPISTANSVVANCLVCPVGAADSGTTVTFTLGTAHRWNIKGVVESGVTQAVDAVTSAQQSSTGNTTSIATAAITPVKANCVQIVLASAHVASNTTATVNQDTGDGFTDSIQSSTTNASNANLLVDVQTKPLSGQAGVAQAAPTVTTSANIQQNNSWMVTIAPAVVGGGSVVTLDDMTYSDAVARSQATQSRTSSDTFTLGGDVATGSHATFRSSAASFAWSSSNPGQSFLANTAHTFTPPQIPFPLNMDDPRHLGRYMQPKGVSVLKINGVYLTIEYPTDSQINSATEVYFGGHAYTVTPATAAALIAAGYQVDTPFSLGGTGNGNQPPIHNQGDPGAPGWDPTWVGYVPNMTPFGTPDPPTPGYSEDI